MQTTNKTSFPSGISRRKLLATVPALALSNVVFSQQAPQLTIEKINCFEIRVSDPARSQAFYQDLFGMPVQARFGDRVCLRIGNGPHYMAIRRMLPGETPAITYLGYSVPGFAAKAEQDALVKHSYRVIAPPALSAAGIDTPMATWIRMRGDTPELFFSDARGLVVQLSDVSNCGGTGALGNVCGAPEAAPPGIFKLSDISHFTAFVSDGAAANTYYQETFGLKPQTYQGPGSPVTGIGDGYQFVMYGGGAGGPGGPGGAGAAGAPAAKTPANINHGSLNMEGFNVEAVLAKLTAYGIKDRGEAKTGPLMHYVSLRMPNRGGAEGGTPELYFTDPDGILMQLQDISYCGGGGYLGNECLKG